MSKFSPLIKTTGAAAQRRKRAPENLKIEPPRGRGRPRGGRSGDKANYQALTIYIAKDVHGQVGAKLHLERRQYSDVIERLLQRWLQKPDLA